MHLFLNCHCEILHEHCHINHRLVLMFPMFIPLQVLTNALCKSVRQFYKPLNGVSSKHNLQVQNVLIVVGVIQA